MRLSGTEPSSVILSQTEKLCLIASEMILGKRNVSVIQNCFDDPTKILHLSA